MFKYIHYFHKFSILKPCGEWSGLVEFAGGSHVDCKLTRTLPLALHHSQWENSRHNTQKFTLIYKRNTPLIICTLTFLSSAGTPRKVGSAPSLRKSFPANSAVYWPRLEKQSVLKWRAQTNRFLPTVAGTWPSKMKSIHAALLSSAAGTRWSDLWSSLQPTTEHLAWRLDMMNSKLPITKGRILFKRGWGGGW